MTKIFSLPRGTADILPENISVWQSIEKNVRGLFFIYGYKEIRTPIFEETDLFARSMGQTSDVVQKQMLNIMPQNTSEEQESKSFLSLRPENTASVVRSYIENSVDRKESLTKLFYIGPMFRGERPQKGRLRQFHQIGVEALGPGSSFPYLDVEVIALGVHILKSLGLNNFKLKINTLGTPEDKENFSKFLREALQSKLSLLCPDCQNRFERNVFRILDCKVKTCQEIVQSIKMDYSFLSPDSLNYFNLVKEGLDQIGIAYEVDHHLVRGLDYYTHTVFEISDSSLGSQNALGAGGRYNNLVSQLGGPAVDAIGFALGMERIILALGENKSENKESISTFIVAMDDASLKKAFVILNELRQSGVSSDMSYRLSSMKSQMRQADKQNARSVIIIGENEIKKEAVALKDMGQGTQEEVSIKNNNYQALTKILQERYK